MESPSKSGVNAADTDRRLLKFAESVSFDRRLFAHDIQGSIAHARMLAKQGLIEQQECEQIVSALGEIQSEIGAAIDQLSKPSADGFQFRDELEDIHMHIEQALIDRLGDVGRKLHTARSRNDQIATDLRLWSRDAIDRIDGCLLELQKAFVGRCDADRHVILPAYTHLQRAQPVLAPHYWLAYCEKFARDRGRLADCRKRLNRSSLGSAALAGTSLDIDREMTARDLGFDDVAANSIDVSSDRDFALELAFALTVVAEHLSGWAEEWILWSTVEFNFLEIPRAFCTGSSIMPQKINPDTLELIRGKTARVIGNLQTLLVLIKGLPLAYNRDLQEDKPPLFDSVETVESCLQLAAPIVESARLRPAAIGKRLEEGYLDATTFMEYLINRGVPQRTAHHLVGQLVGKAMAKGVPLADLPLEEFQQLHADLDESVFDVLGVERAVAAFKSYGSTAPAQVDAQVQRWKKSLGIS